jgi:hypothetical protein
MRSKPLAGIMLIQQPGRDTVAIFFCSRLSKSKVVGCEAR